VSLSTFEVVEIDDIPDSELNLNDKRFYVRPMSFRARSAYHRFRHYFERYTTHIASREADKVSRERHEGMVYDVLRQVATEKDALAMVERAHRARVWAREVLIWSYPFAYFLTTNGRRLREFENVQGDVELFNEAIGQFYAGYKHTYNLESGLATLEKRVRGLERRTEMLLNEATKGGG
jgi:ariadne-1